MGTSGRKVQKGIYLRLNREDLTKPLKLGISDFLLLLFENTFLCFLLCFSSSSLCFCFIKTAFSAPPSVFQIHLSTFTVVRPSL